MSTFERYNLFVIPFAKQHWAFPDFICASVADTAISEDPTLDIFTECNSSV